MRSLIFCAAALAVAAAAHLSAQHTINTPSARQPFLSY